MLPAGPFVSFVRLEENTEKVREKSEFSGDSDASNEQYRKRYRSAVDNDVD